MKLVSFSDFLKINNHHEQMDFVKELFNQLRSQERELMFYKDIEKHLSFSNSNVSQFDISENPIITDISLNQYYAITITFDPKRFDNLDIVTEESQQKYILTKLYDFVLKGYEIGLLYGCFERHKSGIIHSHLIISIYDIDAIYSFLIQQFSSSKRNKHCILIKTVDNIEKWLSYINKEQEDKQYYYLRKHDSNSLDI